MSIDIKSASVVSLQASATVVRSTSNVEMPRAASTVSMPGLTGQAADGREAAVQNPLVDGNLRGDPASIGLGGLPAPGPSLVQPASTVSLPPGIGIPTSARTVEMPSFGGPTSRTVEMPSFGGATSRTVEMPSFGGATSRTVEMPGQGAPVAPASPLDELGPGVNVDMSSMLPPLEGLPRSGFDRLQEAVHAARLPDGSPLSAAQKKAVYDVYGLASEGLDDAGADAVADKLAVALKNSKEFQGNLITGNAYRPDASGALAIEHLASLISSPLHPAFEAVGKPEIARQILDRLVAPEETRQGLGTLDCTLATLEGELAFTRPSDFARIAVGLVTRGSAPLTDGSTMPLASFDPSEAGGRSLVDLALQTSLGALAAGTTSWDGQTAIGPRSSEMLHEKLLGGDWATLGPDQVIAFLLSLSSNPDADAVLKGMRESVDGVPKISMRMPDGSLHSMVLLDLGNVAAKGVGLWDPIEGNNITYVNALDFAMRFVRATVPAHWVAAAGEAATANSTEGEGGLTRSGTRKSLA